MTPPKPYNQFQSSLGGMGLYPTQMSGLWSTYKTVGGQAYGIYTRPLMESLYIGSSNVITAGGAYATDIAIFQGVLGFGSGWLGFSSPLPEMPSGNYLLAPLEYSNAMGVLAKETVDSYVFIYQNMFEEEK